MADSRRRFVPLLCVSAEVWQACVDVQLSKSWISFSLSLCLYFLIKLLCVSADVWQACVNVQLSNIQPSRVSSEVERLHWTDLGAGCQPQSRAALGQRIQQGAPREIGLSHAQAYIFQRFCIWNDCLQHSPYTWNAQLKSTGLTTDWLVGPVTYYKLIPVRIIPWGTVIQNISWVSRVRNIPQL